MRGNHHRWREGDDLAALYLQQHGHARLPYTAAEVAQRLGISETTLRMRIGNFKALAGPGGLREWAKQSERVYLEYRDASEPELRQRLLAYLASRG